MSRLALKHRHASEKTQPGSHRVSTAFDFKRRHDKKKASRSTPSKGENPEAHFCGTQPQHQITYMCRSMSRFLRRIYPQKFRPSAREALTFQEFSHLLFLIPYDQVHETAVPLTGAALLHPWREICLEDGRRALSWYLAPAPACRRRFLGC